MAEQWRENIKQELIRKEMQNFNNSQVDAAAHKAIMYQPFVNLEKLTDKDIAELKKGSNEERFKDIPKKCEINKNKRCCKRAEPEIENGPSVLKISPPREAENTDVIISNETTTSLSYPIGKIRVRNIKTMLAESRTEPENMVSKKGSDHPTMEDMFKLMEIKYFCKKYFTKSVQNNIIIITIILNMIALNNEEMDKKMNELLKKRHEARKQPYGLIQVHKQYKKIMKSKMLDKFNEIVSSFEVSEFDIALQLLISTIQAVYRHIYPSKPRSNYDSIVILLLNNNFTNSKILPMLKSISMRPKCTQLSNLIISQTDNPEIVDCMPLFFRRKSYETMNRMKYFQTVTNALTNKSIVNLEELINNAIDQCNSESSSKDSLPSTVNQLSIPSHQSPQASQQGSVVANGPEKNIQSINCANQIIPQENIQSTSTNTPLNTSNGLFNNSLITGVFNNTTSNTIFNSNNQIIMAQIIPVQVINYISTPTIPVPVNPIPQIRNGLNNIYINNDQYQVITTENLDRHVQPILLPIYPVDKCAVIICSKPATIHCSVCLMVRYCSKKCQETHWYKHHSTYCNQLENLRKQTT